MKNNKINLNDEITLKDLQLDENAFNVPKRFVVDFSKARPNFEYVDGERTDKIVGYTFTAIGEREHQALVSVGVDPESIKPIYIFVEDDLSFVEEHLGLVEDLVIELKEPKVRLRFVQAGRSGSYNGVRLVAKGVKLVENKPENKA